MITFQSMRSANSTEISLTKFYIILFLFFFAFFLINTLILSFRFLQFNESSIWMFFDVHLKSFSSFITNFRFSSSHLFLPFLLVGSILFIGQASMKSLLIPDFTILACYFHVPFHSLSFYFTAMSH